MSESLAEGRYPSEFEAIRTIAAKLGIGSPETLRKWVRQAEVDGGPDRARRRRPSERVRWKRSILPFVWGR